jgi:hypothetical protein
VVYIDALLGDMPPPSATMRSRRSTRCAAGRPRLAEQELTPEFAFVRALACEAYYSDFVAPGKDGPARGRRSTSLPPSRTAPQGLVLAGDR